MVLSHMCSFFHKVLIRFRSRKDINKGKTRQLAFYMPRSTFIRRILWRKMNICKFYNDLQATPSVFLLQIIRLIVGSGSVGGLNTSDSVCSIKSRQDLQ